MARYGRNPFGENLYRVVFAPTRRHLCYGSWIPAYPQAGDSWVLEKWLSAYDFTKCTPETWDSTLGLILGPYPARGEYDLAHIFEACPPLDANLEKLTSWIEAGKRNSFNEILTAVRDDVDADAEARRNQRLDRIANALPAFGAAAMSGPGGGRGTKTMPIQFSANDLHLPTKKTMRAAPSGQRVKVDQLIQP